MTAAPIRLPVEGRACGGCNVCCVVLTIKDPQLYKVRGARCPNAEPDNSCRIYDRRPQTCRGFLCGWRQLSWVRPGLRPDQSGVLVRLHAREVDGRPQLAVVVNLLTDDALDADGLAETMAAPVAAGVPVFLEVQGPPGRTNATARVDGILADSVRRRDKRGVLALLRHVWEDGKAEVARGAPAAQEPAL